MNLTSERSSGTVTRAAKEEADLEAVLDATRQLLWIATPAEAADVAKNLITVFGGETVPARSSTSDSLPLDVSFGQNDPLVPSAPAFSAARRLLERHLPSFMLDASGHLSSRTRRPASPKTLPSTR